MSKIALGIAKSIAELHGVGAASGKSNGDDDHLLHGGVHHGAVDHKACTVVDGDADVAEVLVEADVDGLVVGTGFYGIGTCAGGKVTSQNDIIIPVWNTVFRVILK